MAGVPRQRKGGQTGGGGRINQSGNRNASRSRGGSPTRGGGGTGKKPGSGGGSKSMVIIAVGLLAFPVAVVVGCLSYIVLVH